MEYEQIIFDELPKTEFDEIQREAQSGYVGWAQAEKSPDEVHDLVLAN